MVARAEFAHITCDTESALIVYLELPRRTQLARASILRLLEFACRAILALAISAFKLPGVAYIAKSRACVSTLFACALSASAAVFAFVLPSFVLIRVVQAFDTLASALKRAKTAFDTRPCAGTIITATGKRTSGTSDACIAPCATCSTAVSTWATFLAVGAIRDRNSCVPEPPNTTTITKSLLA